MPRIDLFDGGVTRRGERYFFIHVVLKPKIERHNLVGSLVDRILAKLYQIRNEKDDPTFDFFVEAEPRWITVTCPPDPAIKRRIKRLVERAAKENQLRHRK